MDERLAQALGQLSPEQVDALGADISDTAGEYGLTLTPEVVERAAWAALSQGVHPSLSLAPQPAWMPEPVAPATASPEEEFYEEYPAMHDAYEQQQAEQAEAEQRDRLAAELRHRTGRQVRDEELERVADHLEATDGDLDAAVERAGVRSYSDMSDQDADRLQAQRLHDLNAQDTEQTFEVGEDGRPVSEDDWNVYMAARMQGHEIDYEGD
jgi:hypothetical protein